MPRRHLKIALFLLLWHEIAAQFRLGPDSAFTVTPMLFFGGSVVRWYALELAGLSQHLMTAALLWRGALWLTVYGWLAPAIVHTLPLSFTAGGCVGLALLGARARAEFDRRGHEFGKAFFRAHSEHVVAALIATLTIAGMTRHASGSVLPLLGCALLPGLPFSFGWEAASPRAQARVDAAFGEEEMWHDVGTEEL